MHTCVYREKFNDADNVISPQLMCGNVPVYHKTWWHTLIFLIQHWVVWYNIATIFHTCILLYITHICSLLLWLLDACFRYTRQLVKFDEGVKMEATTTSCIFDIIIQTLYSKFVHDPSIVNEKDDLIKPSIVNGYHSTLLEEKLNPCWYPLCLQIMLIRC